MYYTDNDFRLYHHGILGQKWGIRRYQNKDGSLTKEGLTRYMSSKRGQKTLAKYYTKQLNKTDDKRATAKYWADNGKQTDAISRLRQKYVQPLNGTKINFDENAKRYQNQLDKLINELKDIGLSIDSEETNRYVAVGEHIVYDTFYDGSNWQYIPRVQYDYDTVKGIKYKVK